MPSSAQASDQSAQGEHDTARKQLQLDSGGIYDFALYVDRASAGVKATLQRGPPRRAVPFILFYLHSIRSTSISTLISPSGPVVIFQK